MKKIFALLLTALLCLCCFVSCDYFKHEHTLGEWEYDRDNHWRVSSCTWNICDIDPLTENHVDEDKDKVCDICGYNYRPILNITFKSVDYNGGYTQTYFIDFENNLIKTRGYLPYSEEESEFTILKTFSGKEGSRLLDKLYVSGFFSIDEYYPSPEGIIDGGGWDLVVEYDDGTTKKSKGSNNSPKTVFSEAAKAFYDLCGDGIVGYVPTEYYCPPNISYTFSSSLGGMMNYSPFGKRGDYKWNSFEASNNDLYELNESYDVRLDFYEGGEYSVLLYTANYNSYMDYEKFQKCIVKSFDYNEALTNEETVYVGGWFRQTTIDLELNKIYLVRLEFENGDFVEWTFNTKAK